MADINAYLREAINGPAPQHKVAGRNQFEISEGSDGATHTKIVDVDGNPLSSVPVEDKAVKAELAEIKATQAEILDRLDGTFDTRLTGSIFGLDFSLTDEIISPGTRVDLFFPPSSKPTTYKKLNIIIRLNSRADYDIEIMNLINGPVTGYNSLYNVTNSIFEVVEHEMVSDLIRIRFVNNGSEDISLHGYKIVGVN